MSSQLNMNIVNGSAARWADELCRSLAWVIGEVRARCWLLCTSASAWSLPLRRWHWASTSHCGKIWKLLLISLNESWIVMIKRVPTDSVEKANDGHRTNFNEELQRRNSMKNFNEELQRRTRILFSSRFLSNSSWRLASREFELDHLNRSPCLLSNAKSKLDRLERHRKWVYL